MAFEISNEFEELTQIKVIGIGGGGGNAINRMVDAGIQGVEFIAVNTDKQVLVSSKADQKLQLGEKITGGKGAGAKPEVGKKAAEESEEAINAILKGTDMVFITAGMGGGTGTGAAPVIAQMAKDSGILTVGIVTKPFAFEGKRRMDQAIELAQHVDSLIVIPNERLKLVTDQKITIVNAFRVADDILHQGVSSITNLIKVPGLINLDFADITSVMKDAGHAHMGIGKASGKERAELAAKAAISSPLLETTIEGSMGVIINITGSSDMTLDEVDVASNLVHDEAAPEANIIFGVSIDPDLEDEIDVTVIATGFGNSENKIAPKAEAAPAKAAAEPATQMGMGSDDDDLKAIFDMFNSARK